MFDEFATLFNDDDVFATSSEFRCKSFAQWERHRDFHQLHATPRHLPVIEAEEEECFSKLREDGSGCSNADNGSSRIDDHFVELVRISIGRSRVEAFGSNQRLPLKCGRSQEVARRTGVVKPVGVNWRERLANASSAFCIGNHADEFERNWSTGQSRHRDGVATEFNDFRQVSRVQNWNPQLSQKVFTSARQGR